MKDYDGHAIWTENLGKYERGIYYAVHLGDMLGDGRYKVLHKLGNGSFSQVWLAKDQSTRYEPLSNRYFQALKLTLSAAMAT